MYVFVFRKRCRLFVIWMSLKPFCLLTIIQRYQASELLAFFLLEHCFLTFLIDQLKLSDPTTSARKQSVLGSNVQLKIAGPAVGRVPGCAVDVVVVGALVVGAWVVVVFVVGFCVVGAFVVGACVVVAFVVGANVVGAFVVGACVVGASVDEPIVI